MRVLSPPLQVLSLHDLPRALPEMGWIVDPCALIPLVEEMDPPTVDQGLEGVPGHVYAHILAERLRKGQVSLDTSDHLIEAAVAAAIKEVANGNARVREGCDSAAAANPKDDKSPRNRV